MSTLANESSGRAGSRRGLQDSAFGRLGTVARGNRFYILMLASAVAVAVLLSALGVWPIVRAVVAVALVGVLLAYLTGPAVDALRRRIRTGPRRRPLPRAIAVGAVLMVVLAAVGGSAALLRARFATELASVGRDAPAHVTSMMARLRAIDQVIEQLGAPAAALDVTRSASMTLTTVLETAAKRTLDDLVQSAPYLAWLAAAPLLTFVLLNHAPIFRRSAVRSLPRGHLRWRAGEILRDANSTLAAYTRAQLVSVGIMGGLCILGFAALGLPYAVLIGALGGILELLPLVGPLTTALVATNVSQTEGVILVLVFLGLARLVQDYVIYPRLIRRGMRLHPLAVITAILMGAELGGFVGVFIAVPTLGLMAVTIRHWREYHDIERLVAAHASKQDQVSTSRS